MSQTIDLELVRQGDAHLKRAKELNPNVTARPVPVADVGAFDVPTLARLAGVHQQTIRRAIAKGELKAARNGRYSQARVSRTDAEIWWRERGGGTLLGDLAPTVAPVQTGAKTSRKEAIARGFGFLKGKARSSDDFLAERHAEARAETEKDETRARRQPTGQLTDVSA